MTPWQGDACSLVEEFRAGRRSPAEELAAVYAAIDASDLNAFCFTPREDAAAAAERADVSKPFGGVPIGVKELDHVSGWPYTHASVPLRDDVSDVTSTMASQRPGSSGGAIGFSSRIQRGSSPRCATGGRHDAMAGRRLLAGRGVPGRAALAGRGAHRGVRGDRRQ